MKPQIAVQLYTIRDHVKTAADFAASLKKISDIGYTAVQLSAVAAMEGDSPEVDAKTCRQMLDDNGLKCAATHVGWNAVLNNAEKEIETHQILGCDYTAIGSLGQDYKAKGADGYRQFVADSEPVIAKLKAGGLRFGYHNHAFEFERYAMENGEPVTFFDIFLNAKNPDLTLELDLYWISHAGVNPERILEKAAGRIPFIHIKDKEVVDNEPRMAPIGEGNLDWANLIPACEKNGVDWICVEQDNTYRDAFDCLKSSFEYLSKF